MAQQVNSFFLTNESCISISKFQIGWFDPDSFLI